MKRLFGFSLLFLYSLVFLNAQSVTVQISATQRGGAYCREFDVEIYKGKISGQKIAELSSNGKKYITTELTAGYYNFKAVGCGYAGKKQNVLVEKKGSGKIEVVVNLLHRSHTEGVTEDSPESEKQITGTIPNENVCQVTFSANIKGAELTVDKKNAGHTPQTLTLQTDIEHEVRFYVRGFIGFETRFIIPKGQATAHVKGVLTTGLEDNKDIVWSQTFGRHALDYVRDMIITKDGGYLVLGDTQCYGAGIDDFMLIKLDKHGNLIWKKTYGGSGSDCSYAITQTNDGGYVLAGTSNSFNSGPQSSNDMWIIKLDAWGNIIWENTFGGKFTDIAKSIIQTDDGGYAVTGVSFRAIQDPRDHDIIVMKLDSNGKSLWIKKYSSGTRQNAEKIIQTPDKGYLILGVTNSLSMGSKGLNDILLLKLDARGNEQWHKTYGGPGNDNPNDMIRTNDGGYILVGETASFGNVKPVRDKEDTPDTICDIWVIKLTAHYKQEWQKTYGGEIKLRVEDWVRDYSYERPRSICQTHDGGYVIAGTRIASTGSKGTHLLILRINARGKKLWEKTFYWEEGVTCDAIVTDADGSYIVAGDVLRAWGGGLSDWWIFKFKR